MKVCPCCKMPRHDTSESITHCLNIRKGMAKGNMLLFGVEKNDEINQALNNSFKQ